MLPAPSMRRIGEQMPAKGRQAHGGLRNTAAGFCGRIYQNRSALVTGLCIFTLGWPAVYALSSKAFFFPIIEYGPVELLQFGLYIFASALCFLIAARQKAAGATFIATCYALLGLACFFVAGEEVSWGQEVYERIFSGFPTKEELQAFNRQGETTLHNIYGASDYFQYAFIAISLFGIASTLTRSFVGERRREWPLPLQHLLFPKETLPLFALSALYFVAWFFRTGFEPDLASAFRRYQEVLELCIVTALVLCLCGRVGSRAAPAQDDLG